MVKSMAFPLDTSGRFILLKNRSGRWFGVISLVLAAVSLGVAPVVFGTLGILSGMIAVVKGERYLGMLGVIASAVLATTGYYIAGALLG